MMTGAKQMFIQGPLDGETGVRAGLLQKNFSRIFEP
jgi:hypothetical protein